MVDGSSTTNPYGARPGGGISLPDYYRPWPAITNRNMFLPGTEVLPEIEMRITLPGSSPWPPSNLQKGTSMLVELGKRNDRDALTQAQVLMLEELLVRVLIQIDPAYEAPPVDR